MNQGGGGLRRFNRVSAISMAAVMVWMCLAGGYVLLISGDTFGWVVIAFGLVLIFSPRIPWFRWYWKSDDRPPAYAVILIIGNVAMILLTGSIAWAYLQDPFLIYNDLDTLAAIVFGVAPGLSLLALVANIVALQLDRRVQ